jgi:hypothetical protein
LKDVSAVAIGELRVPLEYCPPGTDPARCPRAVFRADEYVGIAVRALEALAFSIRPLDILQWVHLAIKATGATVAHYSSGTIMFFPFEI